MSSPKVPSFDVLIRRYLGKGIHWGHATTEDFGGERANRWDCSYFVARILRDILGDQSFGHDEPLKYIWAGQQFANLVQQAPGPAGFSLPMIGLADMEEEENLWGHCVHIGFLVTPVVYKRLPDWSASPLNGHRHAGGGIIDVDKTLVCDLAQNSSDHPTHDEPAIHPMRWWFPDGYDWDAAFTEGRMVQLPYFAVEAGVGTDCRYVVMTDGWLNETKIATHGDAFNAELRRNDFAIP